MSRRVILRLIQAIRYDLQRRSITMTACNLRTGRICDQLTLTIFEEALMNAKMQLRAAAFMVAISMFAPFATAAVVTRSILKEFFQTGDIPSEQDFADVIDSSLNLLDDGLTSYRIG